MFRTYSLQLHVHLLTGAGSVATVNSVFHLSVHMLLSVAVQESDSFLETAQIAAQTPALTRDWQGHYLYIII